MTDQPSNKPAVLITGGAIRLGRALATHLAQQGHPIALHYNRSEDSAREALQTIKAMGVDCELFQADLSDAKQLEPLIATAKACFPSLSILVNSASVYDQAPIAEMDISTFDRQFAVNLRAPFFLTQAFAKLCSGPDSHASVINILDNKIAYNQYQYSAYLLSKKALAEFTRMAAMEFAPNLRVNGVAPGVVLPASVRSDDYIQWRIDGIPLKQQGAPAQIAQALQYFLDNRFVTGQINVVDGGESSAHIGQNAASYEQQQRREVIVAVGSNIEPEDNVQRVKQILASELRLQASSEFRWTKPVGYTDQPDFLNGAVKLSTCYELDELKKYLRSVESRMGRVRANNKAGPRVIDLDIIVWDGEIVHDDYHQHAHTSVPVDELLKGS